MTDKQKGEGAETVEDLLWRFGSAEFDERSWLLRVEGIEIELEPRPLEILAYLLRHAGEVVTKDELLDAIWGRSVETISDKVLTNAIGKLRRALRDEQEQVIATIHRRGYRLVASVSRVVLARRVVPKLDLKPGDAVPRREQWQLLRALDISARSEVWLAEHAKTHERRVFKFSPDGARLSSLKREVTLSRVLRESLGERPEFVKVLEWNFEEAPYFIECEYGGDDWTQWAEAQGGLAAVPFDTRLELFVQAAAAIGAAHGVGVLHKDLKPANLLIAAVADSSLQVRLTDFGSGRLLEQGRLSELGITRLGFTQTQAVSSDSLTGTPLYLAPELLAGQVPTQASDVYALGVLLYQLVIADFRKPLSAGWEREVQDELLREDIALAAAGDPALRLDSARALAQRVARLPQRRRERAEAQRRQAEIEVASVAQQKTRARRPWVIAAAVALLAGLVISLSLLRQVSRSETLAAAEARSARAINQFLNEELIARASPRVSGRSNVTVLEAAKAAREAIPVRFKDQARIEASLHRTMGNVLADLGDYPDALAELGAAREVLGRHFGAADQDAVSACFTFASTQARAADTKAARDTFSRCDAVFSKQHKPGAEAQFARAYASGRIAQYAYDPTTAAASYQEALKLIPLLPADEANQAYLVRQNLGSVLSFGSKGRDAEQVLRPLVIDLQKHFGSEHYLTLDAKTTLAQSLLLQGKYADAQLLYEALIPPLTKQLGADHESTLQTRGELGFAYAENGREDDAVQLLRDVVARLERTLGKPHLLTQANVGSLASALQMTGQLQGALQLQRESRDIVMKQLGADNPFTQVTRFNLADMLLEQGDAAAAELELKSVKAEVMQQGAPADDWQARLDIEQAKLIWLRGDKQRARTLLETALPKLDAKSPDSIRVGAAGRKLITAI